MFRSKNRSRSRERDTGRDNGRDRQRSPPPRRDTSPSQAKRMRRFVLGLVFIYTK